VLEIIRLDPVILFKEVEEAVTSSSSTDDKVTGGPMQGVEIPTEDEVEI